MNPFIQRAQAEIQAATGHLTVAETAREVPGKWSVAEILEHLTLAFEWNAGALEKALASGDRRAGRVTLRRWLGRVLVIDIGYFPRARAPESTTPRGSVPPERSREAILEALAALDSLLARAADRFGERTPLLKHPYFGGLTVGQWQRFHWRHTVHHMRQVRARSRTP
jgi:hypothetical protein